MLLAHNQHYGKHNKDMSSFKYKTPKGQTVQKQNKLLAKGIKAPSYCLFKQIKATSRLTESEGCDCLDLQYVNTRRLEGYQEDNTL